MSTIRKQFALLFFVITATWSSLTMADSKPWRLDDILVLPQEFSISGQHRIRFETLDNQFRGNRGGGDQVLLLRTLIFAKLDLKQIRFAVEMEDSRTEQADSGTPLSTSVVNPLELLQAYAEIPVNDLFATGSTSTLRAGRITMDLGSRRLVARNRFRNTINAFTGIDWQWTGPDKTQVRAFYTLPVQRRVSGSLLDNDPEFDRESTDVRFWGLYYAPGRLPWGDMGEVYFLGLNENDAPELATRNRDIYSLGTRLYRPAKKSRFDYQVEAVYQFGNSRSTTAASNVTDLDNSAYFIHLEAGYSIDATWSPQVVLQYDYASGDSNNSDGDNNRFDTLFGARRFDFGPTSIYGPFARANISSPGIRIKFKPQSNISSFVAIRGFWLANHHDAWTTAGISNAPGVSKNFIGTQIEGRLTWEPLPGNLGFEAGAAHIFAGDIMDNASKSDSTYFYTQAVFSF